MLISFVLPAYKAEFLKQSIDSILSQEYTNFELIIVNDSSPENIEEIVHSYKDGRIKYYKNKENIGSKSLVNQWNHCIKYASGEFLVLAADDDIYDKSFLTKCVRLANKHPNVDIIRSRVKVINENNELINIDAVLPEFISKYGYLYYYMTGYSFVCIGNFMFRSSVIKEKGFIDYPSAFCSDISSTIMMSEKGCANTKDMLFSFRISNIHLSSSKSILHLKNKIQATTLLFSYIFSLKYERPNSVIDLFFYNKINNEYIYNKALYDYYNQAIKYLPISKLYYIKECSLLKKRDKFIMLIRFCVDKIFK